MNCPSDGTTLLMSERQGVEIDYCPQCRGVWLDRGELDKILDRARLESEPADAPAPAPQSPAPQQAAPQAAPQWDNRQQHQYQQQPSRDSYGQRPQQYQKRKKSPFEFLGDLFEG